MSITLEALYRTIAWIGLLRVLLLVAALASLVLRPAPGTPVAYSGWALVVTLVVPVAAPLVFMTLLLDAMMTAIFMTDKEGSERKRYRTLALVDLVLALASLLWWWPYYAALGK